MAAIKTPVATKAPARPAAAPARPAVATKAPARPAPTAARPAAAPAAKAPVRAPAPAAKAPAPAPARAPARAAAPAPAPAASNGADPALVRALKQMKQRFNAAKEESKKGGGAGGTTANPGRHECRLTDARIVTSPGLAVVLEFTVVSGDDTGEKCVRYDNLDTDERIIYFQRDLRRLGVEVDDFDIEQLPQLCAELIEAAPLVRMSVKEKDGYLNAYIDKLLEEGEVAEDVVEQAVTEGEEGAPAEEVAEEAPEEEEAAAEEEGEAPAEEETATIDRGDQVAYTNAKGVACTGEITEIYDDNTVDIKNDKTTKVDNVALDAVEKLVATEE